jgi:protein-disulfide isomerase
VSKKTWIIFAAICVVVLGGLVFLSRRDQVSVGDVDQSKILAASAASGNIADHVFGPTSGKTILIEYGDFQCPACGSAYPILKDVTDTYKDKLTFIFRNNPLTTIHPNARAGAAAAEAAGLQGKYWQMHDALYENQESWSSAATDKRLSFFESYAKQVGVANIDKFKTDMESKGVSDKINFDLALGKKIPVTGTPTILLGGKQIDSGTWSDKDKMKAAVEDALK